MTESAQQPRFIGRPPIPGTETQEYVTWSQNWTINYDGGYIQSAYGNLAQTWDLGLVQESCTDLPVAVVRKAHNRVNSIGMDPTPVKEARFTYNKFPRRNSSLSAGGDAYTIHTDIGSYTARIGGDVQDFMKWACSNANITYGTTSIQTSHGAWYGPISRDTTV